MIKSIFRLAFTELKAGYSYVDRNPAEVKEKILHAAKMGIDGLLIGLPAGLAARTLNCLASEDALVPEAVSEILTIALVAAASRAVIEKAAPNKTLSQKRTLSLLASGAVRAFLGNSGTRFVGTGIELFAPYLTTVLGVPTILAFTLASSLVVLREDDEPRRAIPQQQRNSSVSGPATLGSSSLNKQKSFEASVNPFGANRHNKGYSLEEKSENPFGSARYYREYSLGSLNESPFAFSKESASSEAKEFSIQSEAQSNSSSLVWEENESLGDIPSGLQFS